MFQSSLVAISVQDVKADGVALLPEPLDVHFNDAVLHFETVRVTPADFMLYPKHPFPAEEDGATVFIRDLGKMNEPVMGFVVESLWKVLEISYVVRYPDGRLSPEQRLALHR